MQDTLYWWADFNVFFCDMLHKIVQEKVPECVETEQ